MFESIINRIISSVDEGHKGSQLWRPSIVPAAKWLLTVQILIISGEILGLNHQGMYYKQFYGIYAKNDN